MRDMAAVPVFKLPPAEAIPPSSCHLSTGHSPWFVSLINWPFPLVRVTYQPATIAHWLVIIIIT